MTGEEYYGQRNYKRLAEAQTKLEKTVCLLRDGFSQEDDIQPIVYYCSRIKKPESMMRKLRAKGLPCTVFSAMNGVYDALGFRIVCAFESDVHLIVDEMEKCELFSVEKKKDYLGRPKPNGYRSIHLCVRMNDSGVLAEIQVRTIAMDCWATLEHQMKYKRNIENESLIRSELKRCADEIASVDLSMQTIREIIKEI